MFICPEASSAQNSTASRQQPTAKTRLNPAPRRCTPRKTNAQTSPQPRARPPLPRPPTLSTGSITKTQTAAQPPARAPVPPCKSIARLRRAGPCKSIARTPPKTHPQNFCKSVTHADTKCIAHSSPASLSFARAWYDGACGKGLRGVDASQADDQQLRRTAAPDNGGQQTRRSSEPSPGRRRRPRRREKVAGTLGAIVGTEDCHAGERP